MIHFILKRMLVCVALLCFSADASDINVVYHADLASHDGNCQTYNITIDIPAGWKMSRPPLIHQNNLNDCVRINSSEEIHEVADGKYQCEVQVESNADVNGSLELEIENYLCKDVCVIDVATIHIPLGEGHGSFYSAELMFMLIFGLIGGCLLNLMPCVLPVLLMKVKALGSGSKSAVYASILGNYMAFAVLLIALGLLKIGGQLIGWGMHFQNIYFLFFVTVVMFLLLLYSLDMIMIFPSISYSEDGKGVFWSNFISSCVAAVMAVPCTAPFLGAAAAFAIQGSILQMICVFSAIATGFSAPYFIALCYPRLFSMNFSRYGLIFKRITSVGVAIAFMWVFYLLCMRIYGMYIAILVASFVLLYWFFRNQWHRYAALSLIALLLMMTCCDISKNIAMDVSLQQLESARASDRVVMFDISADWCLTCQYNKKMVFSDERVRSCLEQYDVVVIHADLTAQNDELMKFIHEHKRAGIPFTIVYGPGKVDGILLNEMPSVEEIVNAIEKSTKRN